MKDPDCIFCKIANGEIPTDMVFQDELVAAFGDMNPQAPVHVLVVPKDHYAHIADDVPADVIKHMVDAVGEVARIKGVDKSGFRVIANTGDDAGQTVHHFHMHVLGGKNLGEGLIAD